MSKRYNKVELAGEIHFQAAVANCVPGYIVRIVHDPHNPYDISSLAVFFGKDRIGYIPADSFVQKAYFDDRKGVFGRISSVTRVSQAYVHVVLDVAIVERADVAFLISAYSYSYPELVFGDSPPAPDAPRGPQKRWLARLLAWRPWSAR